jgi:hypothetical protein
LRKNHRHTGMDLCYELIRLACDNRISAQPILQIRDLRADSVAKEPARLRRLVLANGLRFSCKKEGGSTI